MTSNKSLTISIAYLQELAHDVMLELTNDELEDIGLIEQQIRAKLTNLLKINTTGLTPLNYPFETPHQMLREDQTPTTVPQKLILKNAPEISGDFITLTKVIK